MVVLGKNSFEDGISSIMGFPYYGVHHYGVLFYPSKWRAKRIMQGDPLSLYLFLFCAEDLNGILKQVLDAREIQGFSICKRVPKLTHIFFVEDCLLFCRSTLKECEKIQDLLAVYESASGQMF